MGAGLNEFYCTTVCFICVPLLIIFIVFLQQRYLSLCKWT